MSLAGPSIQVIPPTGGLTPMDTSWPSESLMPSVSPNVHLQQGSTAPNQAHHSAPREGVQSSTFDSPYAPQTFQVEPHRFEPFSAPTEEPVRRHIPPNMSGNPVHSHATSPPPQPPSGPNSQPPFQEVFQIRLHGPPAQHPPTLAHSTAQPDRQMNDREVVGGASMPGAQQASTQGRLVSLVDLTLPQSSSTFTFSSTSVRRCPRLASRKAHG